MAVNVHIWKTFYDLIRPHQLNRPLHYSTLNTSTVRQGTFQKYSMRPAMRVTVDAVSDGRGPLQVSAANLSLMQQIV